jgi:hypothetical protein
VIRKIGRLNGFPIRYCPVKDVLILDSDSPNPWGWFAWTADGEDLIAVGVKTKSELKQALNGYCAEPRV